MEAVIVAWVFYLAIRQAHDSAKAAFKSSRKAYMKRAAKKHPGKSRSRQAASALRHDLGYGLAQLLRGFPVARHGFAQGWHEARKAHAEALAGREKAKTERAESLAGLIEEIRQYRERQAQAAERARTSAAGGTSEGSEEGTPEGSTSPGPEKVIQGAAEEVPLLDEPPSPERYLLTVRSKSGRVLNPITQSPVTTIAVWSREDLDRRFAAAAEDPDLEVSHRPMPDVYDPIPVHGMCPHGVSPACGYCDPDADVVSREPPSGGEPEPEPEVQPANPQNTGGTQMSDTTYGSVATDMTSEVASAENRAAEVNAARVAAEAQSAEASEAKARALRISEDMQALDMDPATLGAIADHIDAAAEADKAHQEAEEALGRAHAASVRVMESAQNVQAVMAQGHAGLAAAHQEAPVEAADKAFYAE